LCYATGDGTDRRRTTRTPEASDMAHCVGKGTYGRVVRRADDPSVVHKHYHETFHCLPGSFLREWAALSFLRHTTVVPARGVVWDDDALFPQPSIVMDAALVDLATRMAGAPIDETRVDAWGSDLLRGLHHVHGMGVAHRDVKPANLLIFPSRDNDGRQALERLVLADLGSCALLPYDPPHLDEYDVCTLQYAAPEVVRRVPYDNRADLWSAAVVLLEAHHGRRLFCTSDRSELYDGQHELCGDAQFLNASPPRWTALLKMDPNERAERGSSFWHTRSLAPLRPDIPERQLYAAWKARGRDKSAHDRILAWVEEVCAHHLENERRRPCALPVRTVVIVVMDWMNLLLTDGADGTRATGVYLQTMACACMGVAFHAFSEADEWDVFDFVDISDGACDRHVFYALQRRLVALVPNLFACAATDGLANE
jgi:serine/threonine protein kinase